MNEALAKFIITETGLIGVLGIMAFSVYRGANHNLIKLGFLGVGLLCGVVSGTGLEKLLTLASGL